MRGIAPCAVRNRVIAMATKPDLGPPQDIYQDVAAYTPRAEDFSLLWISILPPTSKSDRGLVQTATPAQLMPSGG